MASRYRNGRVVFYSSGGDRQKSIEKNKTSTATASSIEIFFVGNKLIGNTTAFDLKFKKMTQYSFM